MDNCVLGPVRAVLILRWRSATAKLDRREINAATGAAPITSADVEECPLRPGNAARAKSTHLLAKEDEGCDSFPLQLIKLRQFPVDNNVSRVEIELSHPGDPEALRHLNASGIGGDSIRVAPAER